MAWLIRLESLMELALVKPTFTSGRRMWKETSDKSLLFPLSQDYLEPISHLGTSEV